MPASARRPAVIWRMLSFATPSLAASRFVETLLTVIDTCQRQPDHNLDHLTAAPQPPRRSTGTFAPQQAINGYKVVKSAVT
jgi:hypothetical protein